MSMFSNAANMSAGRRQIQQYIHSSSSNPNDYADPGYYTQLHDTPVPTMEEQIQRAIRVRTVKVQEPSGESYGVGLNIPEGTADYSRATLGKPVAAAQAPEDSIADALAETLGARTKEPAPSAPVLSVTQELSKVLLARTKEPEAIELAQLSPQPESAPRARSRNAVSPMPMETNDGPVTFGSMPAEFLHVPEAVDMRDSRASSVSSYYNDHRVGTLRDGLKGDNDRRLLHADTWYTT